MRVDTLFLRNFRNYRYLNLELDPHLNIFVGANAQGKTNLLESLVFLATGSSFRTRNEEELVLWGEDSCTAAAQIIKKQQTEKLLVTYCLKEKKKQYFSNGLELKKSAFSGRLLAVLFTPEDLLVVKGAPQARRKYLDEIICRFSPLYAYSLSRYQHILRQRNQLLKKYREKIIASPELASWNIQLAKEGAKIIRKRQYVLHRLGLLARLAQRNLTGREESLLIKYRTSLPKEFLTKDDEIEQALLRALQENEKNECRLGQSLIGPHRDEIIFLLNNRDARLYASQGQQRTLILALKMAELELIKGECGEFPILLLDDVFSELDEKRRRFVVENIEGKIQTLLTGTTAEGMNAFKKVGKILLVERGEIKYNDPRK
ncbi:MAG: DNA replication/repair protein RecF [Firmicutes bacterium]|nr:DNA replication/repair protein RecF [Bacillota bacterium]